MGMIASDNFNRADANPIGGNWTTVTSEIAWKILSNHAEPTAFNNDASIYYAGTWPADQYSQAKITVNGSAGSTAGAGVCIRASTSLRTYYRLTVDHAGSNNINLTRIVNGTSTSLWTRTVTFVDGDLIRLEAQGSVLRAMVNGVAVGADFVDTSPITSGNPGLTYSSIETSSSAEDWEGGDLTSARQAPGLQLPPHLLKRFLLAAEARYRRVPTLPVVFGRVDLTHQISNTSGNFGTGSFVTSSFTPPDNSLIAVAVMLISGSQDPLAAMTISGGGLTWTSRKEQAAGFSGGTENAIIIYTAPVTTGASMTITVDCGAQSISHYIVSAVAYTGYDVASPVGATGSLGKNSFAGPPTPESFALSGTPASSSEIFAGANKDADNAGTTPGAAFTELADLFNTTWTGGGQTQVRPAGSTSTTVDWVDIRPAGGGLFSLATAAIEIKAAPGGGGPDPSGTGDSGVVITLDSTGARDSLGVSDLGVVATVAATGARNSAGIASLDVAIALAGTGSAPAQGVAAFGVAVALASTGVQPPNQGSAAFTVDVALAATGARNSTGVGAIGVVIAAVATGARNSTGVGALGMDVALVGAGARASQGVAALSAVITLAGTGARNSLGVGALAADIALAATGARNSTGVGAIGVVIALESVGSSGGGTGVANFGVVVALAGTGARNSSGVASVVANVALAGVGNASSQGVAAFGVVVTLVGTGARQSVGVTAFGVDVALAGSGLRNSLGVSLWDVAISIVSIGVDPAGVTPVVRLLRLSSDYRVGLKASYRVGLDAEPGTELDSEHRVGLETEYEVGLTWNN